MPLQIRRGTEIQRQAMTVPLASGELLYVTDDQRLYIGNGTTLGGVLITGFTAEDAQDAVAPMFTSGSHTAISFSYDDANNRINAVVDLSNYEGVIRASSLSGSLASNDSTTILIDGENGSINLNGTVKGDIVPDANEVYDIGSASNKFKDLYLSGTSIFLGNATITANVDGTVNLPSGSTIGGIDIAALAGQGVISADVVADDSTVMVNVTTKEITAAGGFIGDLTGNVTGDVTGSIFTNTIDSVDSSFIVVFPQLRADGGIYVDSDMTVTDRIYGSIEGSVFDQAGNILVDADTQSLSNGTIDIVGNVIRVKAGNLDLQGVNGVGQSGTQVRVTGLAVTTDNNPAAGRPFASGNIFNASLESQRFDIRSFKGSKDTGTNTDISSGDVFCGIGFVGVQANDTEHIAAIGVQADPAGTLTSSHIPTKIFFINKAATSGGTPVAMTFDSLGRLAVNQQDAAATIDINGFAKLAVLTAEPASPANGMVAIADGATWDPAGTGKSVMVVYLAGGWRVAATAP